MLAVGHHPAGDERAAAADDPRDPLRGEAEVLLEQPGVDGHVVDPLLGLLLAHVDEVLGAHVLNVAAEFFEHLIDRHRPDRHRRGVDDRLTDAVDVLARRQVHDGVGAVVDGEMELFELGRLVAGDGRIADVGVDLRAGSDADRHRLELLRQMDDVRRDHHPPAGHLRPDRFLGKVFTLGNEGHLGGDRAGTGLFELSHGGLRRGGLSE